MKNYIVSIISVFSVLVVFLYSGSNMQAADSPSILIQSGQKIGFLGDSITAQGTGPNGYVTLVVAGLTTNGINVTAVPAGIPGNTSAGMKKRVDRDVLSKGVDWMTLSCGVNDIHLQDKGLGVDLDQYKQNITSILDAARAKNVKIMVLTLTPIGEDLDSPNNKSIDSYNQFLQEIVKERGLILADVNAAFKKYLKAPPPKSFNKGHLLGDGVHPNFDGQHLMAEVVLRAFGISDEEIFKAEQTWPKTPIRRVR